MQQPRQAFAAKRLTREAQWDLLDQYLEDIPLLDTRIKNANWMPSINRGVHLTFPVEKRGDFGILKPDTEHADVEDEGVGFLGWDNYRVDLVSRPRDHGAEVEGDSDDAEEAQNEEAECAHSPTSPTFGPRRNQIFSGTVKRRRLQAPPLVQQCVISDSDCISAVQAQSPLSGSEPQAEKT